MAVPSPCKAACCLNDDRRFCLSCGRRLEDISNWSRMSDEDKLTAITIAEHNKKVLDI